MTYDAAAISSKMREVSDSVFQVNEHYFEMLMLAASERDIDKSNKLVAKKMREIGEELLAVGSRMIRAANFIEPMLDERAKGKNNGEEN